MTWDWMVIIHTLGKMAGTAVATAMAIYRWPLAVAAGVLSFTCQMIGWYVREAVGG